MFFKRKFTPCPALRLRLPQQNRCGCGCGCGRSPNRNEFSIFWKLMLKTYKRWKQNWKCDYRIQRSCLKIKLCKKFVLAKNFAHFYHFLQCKFTWRTNLKDFRELVLTYVRPSEKCKDFMKTFPKNFDPIFGVAVVKLRFHVAVAVAVTVAVAVGQTTARRGIHPLLLQFW